MSGAHETVAAGPEAGVHAPIGSFPSPAMPAAPPPGREGPAATGGHALPSSLLLTRIGLAAIVVLAVVLRFAAFDRVAGTPFYDAAVRSMGLSWHDFFYGALEPGGQVSIDKAPVDLWLQVASTKLFGFSSVSLRLPQALAGTLAVPLLYDLVRRGFGRPAGLAAAAALAVLPISVLTARSDTMDTVMGTLLLLAAWLIVRATPERRTRAVIVAGAIAGLAFEVKLFQAMIGLPALAVLAWLLLDGPPLRRLRTLAGAGLAFVAVAAAWAVVASLLPGAHPFPVGSTDGSIANVLLVYNGLDRIGGPASGAPVTNLLGLTDPAHHQHLVELIGIELAAALVLGAFAVVAAVRFGRWGDPGDEQHRRIAVAAALGTWLLAGTFVFSLMGQLRPRYLEAFTPAVAGVLGIALVTLGGLALRRRRAALSLLVGGLAAGIGVPLAMQAHGTALAVSIVAALVAAALALLLAVRPAALRPARPATGLATAAVGLSLVAILATPLATSAGIVRDGRSDSGVAGRMPASRVERLSAYLRAHQGSARYEVASAGITLAAPLIVRDGRPVLMLASIAARPLVSPEQLAVLARRGDVRYALMTRGRSTVPAVNWVRRHGVDVSREAGVPAGLLYRIG